MTELTAEQKTLLTPILVAATHLIEASEIAKSQDRVEMCFAIDSILNDVRDVLESEGIVAT